MKMLPCEPCGKTTAHKRMVGVGSILLIVATAVLLVHLVGLVGGRVLTTLAWLPAIALYPQRCVICVTDAPRGKVAKFFWNP